MNKCCARYIGNDDKYLFNYKTMYTLPQHVNKKKKMGKHASEQRISTKMEFTLSIFFMVALVLL